MKKKITLKAALYDMSKMGRIMPRTINESIDFNGLEDEENYDEDLSAENDENVEDEPMKETPAQTNMQSVPGNMRNKVSSFFDDIRKKALLGMAELADYPNSIEYEQMKKLWQMCDKKPDQKQNAL